MSQESFAGFQTTVFVAGSEEPIYRLRLAALPAPGTYMASDSTVAPRVFRVLTTVLHPDGEPGSDAATEGDIVLNRASIYVTEVERMVLKIS